MTTTPATENKPLWLSIEEMILGLSAQDLEAGSKERTVMRLAGNLDEAGYNVSRHAANLLQLRTAINERIAAGRPLMGDFNGAVASLTIDDVVNPKVAAAKLAVGVGAFFPLFKGLDRRPDILAIVEQARLDLFTNKAKELGGEPGVRYLIGAGIAVDVIIEALGISRAEYDQVDAKIAAEIAERKRVTSLVEEAGDDKTDDQRIKLLIDKDVADELILEIGGFTPAALDGVKKAMEAEIAEKKRLAAEEAARKAAEAAGPSLDSIPKDELLDYIENIREILEFSAKENEIRAMCQQSDIPNCLVDIAVSEPGKLDELEEKAGG